MKAIDDGGPAFPRPDWNGNWSGPNSYTGMTLRDYLAAQALPAVFASAIQHNNGTGSTWPVTISEIAEKSYALADAMLEERSK